MDHDILRPTGHSFHPDGRTVAFDLAPGFRLRNESVASRIWQVSHGRPPIQLTFGPGADRSPQFSPCDDTLAFLSDRLQGGRFCLYLLRDGAIEGPLGDTGGTVEKIAWAADGRSITCLVAPEGLDSASSDGATPLEWSDPGDPLIGTGNTRRRVFRVDIDTESVTEIGPRALSVWDFDLAGPDGLVAITSANPQEYGWHAAELVHVDIRVRETTTLFCPEEQLQCVRVAPDAARAAVIEGPASDRNLVAGRLRVISLSDGRVSHPAEQLEDLTHVAWAGKDRLAFAGWSGFGTRYGHVTVYGTVLHDEQADAILGPNRFTARVDDAPDGQGQVAIIDTPDHPAELHWRASFDATWMQMTQFNSWAPDTQAAHRRHALAWTAADGTDIHGLLLEPAEAPAPGPVIIVVHGGPTASAQAAFDPSHAMKYVAAGYRVLVPNYRGSVGRGRKFTRTILGDPAGAEYADILAGVDHLVAQGVADPARLGITGVSYGGYLSAWAACTDTHFAAAVVISGIADLVGCHFTCNHAFSEWIACGPVTDSETRALLSARSPVANALAPSTATLVLHGELDQCTPVSQGQALHRVLKRHGVPARLVSFPREGHAILERDHQKRMQSESIAWFETHLGKGA